MSHADQIYGIPTMQLYLDGKPIFQSPKSQHICILMNNGSHETTHLRSCIFNGNLHVPICVLPFQQRLQRGINVDEEFTGAREFVCGRSCI